MRTTVKMCFAANNILLMCNHTHAIVWKMADHFPELSENDLHMKKKLGDKKIKQLVYLVITNYYLTFIHCTNSDSLIGWFVPCDTWLWQNNLLDVIIAVEQLWCKFNTPLSLYHGFDWLRLWWFLLAEYSIWIIYLHSFTNNELDWAQYWKIEISCSLLVNSCR